jgi:hypothetical protein
MFSRNDFWGGAASSRPGMLWGVTDTGASCCVVSRRMTPDRRYLFESKVC